MLKEECTVPTKLQIVGGKCGEGYVQEIGRTIEEAGFQDSVVFIDHQSDLSDIWANTDVGLVCSANEVFGRVTIEYMAHSMQVIGANAGGTKVFYLMAGDCSMRQERSRA